MKVEEKVKTWVKEHEGQIKAAGLLVGTATFGFAYGYLIKTNKEAIKSVRFDQAFQRCIDAGAIVLLDPNVTHDVKSIPFQEWTGITQEYFRNN